MRKSPPEYRNEAQLVAHTVKAVVGEHPSAWIFKTHGDGYQRRGVPDLLICHGGRMHGIEMKHRKPGETLAALYSRVTVSQRLELLRIAEAGGRATVAWEVAQVLQLLDGSWGGYFPRPE